LILGAPFAQNKEIQATKLVNSGILFMTLAHTHYQNLQKSKFLFFPLSKGREKKKDFDVKAEKEIENKREQERTS